MKNNRLQILFATLVVLLIASTRLIPETNNFVPVFAMILFAASFITLGYLGTKPVNELRTLIAQICTVLYFAPFILMPIYTKYEKTLEVPDRL